MTKPRSEYWDDEPMTAREIHIQDRETFTGLYGPSGRPIYRHPEPFGFDPRRWAHPEGEPCKKCDKDKKRGRR